MKINIFLVLLSCLSFFSCGSEEESSSDIAKPAADSSSETNKLTILKESEGIEKGKIKSILKSEAGSEESSISFMFYRTENLNNTYKKTINQLIYSNLYTKEEGNRKKVKSDISKKDFQESLNTFCQDYREITSEIDVEYDPSSLSPWNMSQTFTIDTNLASYVQLTYSYADYTGGAHGNYGTYHYLVDRNSGKQLSINDLFSNTSQLNRLVEKKFRMNYRVPKGQTLMEFGLFENAIEANNNFYYDSKTKSINFEYNPYEIGPYSMGMATVSIDISMLNNILKVKIE